MFLDKGLNFLTSFDVESTSYNFEMTNAYSFTHQSDFLSILGIIIARYFIIA